MSTLEAGGASGDPIRSQIIGVSIPRSGHHLLIRAVQRVLGKDFYYCEPYVNQCCNTLPCSFGTPARFFFRKSHDFQLTDDATRQHPYVIQCRDFVFSTLSHGELKFRRDPSFGDTREKREHFFAEKAAYFIAFMNKWHRPEAPNYLVIDYDDLTTNTATVVRKVVELYGIQPKPELIRRAAQGARSVGGGGRSLEGSRFYDEEPLQLTESIVLAQLPYLETKRKLAQVKGFEETPLYFAVMGHLSEFNNDPLGAFNFFERAYRLTPRTHFRALADARLGDHYWRGRKHGRARKYYQSALNNGARSQYIKRRLGLLPADTSKSPISADSD